MSRGIDRIGASKPALFLACLLPLALIAWDIRVGDLGPDPVRALEHRTGIWAVRLLLATLAITPLRLLTSRIFARGWTWLTRYRRMLGLFAFFYASVHFAIYLIVDLSGFWSQIIPEIIKKPFITVGFLAWLLMIPLAATSTRAMMRRLGGNWQRLHWLVYPIGLCGVLHFLWQVKFGKTIAVREPVMYLAIYLLLIAARIPTWRQRWLKQRGHESIATASAK
ncbi:MAG: protein-methionine-sulfoxide reductase heme-binding subunit MsrQ [Dokdonella sp.]